MTRRDVWIGAAVVLGLATYGFVRCHKTKTEEHERSVADEEENGPRDPGDPPTASSDPPASDARDAEGAPALDRKRREQMRQAIYRAWGLSAPPSDYRGSARPPPPPSAEEGRPFDKDYIRSRIREDYIPLAKDCYEKGLKKNPKLEGKLTASFRIVGNKNVGGIIDWVDINNDTTTDSQGGSAGGLPARRPLSDKDVVDCLEQSLYSVSFQAPPNDGVVTVTYPLTFSPDPPDGGAD